LYISFFVPFLPVIFFGKNTNKGEVLKLSTAQNSDHAGVFTKF
jgi:hypothetical protein